MDFDPTTQGRRRRRRREVTPTMQLLRLPLGVVPSELWARTPLAPRTQMLRLIGARRLAPIGCVLVEQGGEMQRWSVHPVPPEVSSSDFRVPTEARLLILDIEDADALPLEVGRPHILLPDRPGAEAIVTLA
jgi:hypothetical protein